MSERKKEKEPKKEPPWKPDSSITMTIKKGDLWTPDEKLKMKFQEAVVKKEKKAQ